MTATVTRSTSPISLGLGRSNEALPTWSTSQRTAIADLFEAEEPSYSTVRTLSPIATPENEQQLAV